MNTVVDVVFSAADETVVPFGDSIEVVGTGSNVVVEFDDIMAEAVVAISRSVDVGSTLHVRAVEIVGDGVGSATDEMIASVRDFFEVVDADPDVIGNSVDVGAKADEVIIFNSVDVVGSTTVQVMAVELV